MSTDDSDRNPTEIELRAFVGPRAAHYWRRWRWYIENGKQGAGGLWPPLLFNLIWFLYRRMYREVWVPVAMFASVGIIQGAVEGIIEVRRGVRFTTPKLLDTLINICLGLATSWVGSYLYLRKFRNAVKIARQTSPTPESALEALRQAGGTSRLAAGIGIAVMVALFLLGLLLTDASAG